MMFALLSRLAVAGCDATVEPDTLSATLNEANVAYAAMDEDAFMALALRAQAQIVCLGAVLTPAQVATWDRVDGLRAFVEGDEAAALASFRAARTLDPAYYFSERIAPSGGKLAQLYERAAPVDGADTEEITVGSGVKVWVDGSRSTDRPTEEPAVVQVGQDEQRLDLSLVVRPGDRLSLPASLLVAAPEIVEPEPAPAPLTTRTERQGPKRGVVPMWIATGASALVAGGLFTAAAFTNSEFEVQPSEEVLNTNHATYYGSVGMAGVTLVLAGVSLVVTL